MVMSTQEQLSAFCPDYHSAVELIGRRWTGAILRALLSNVNRFNDLAAAVPGLSDRMLAERLRELETEGVVSRIVIPATPVRVEYTLTEKGRALESVVRAVAEWVAQWPSEEHAAHVETPAGAAGR
jgi:DNA-binding HxlR family transcriptional regulator